MIWREIPAQAAAAARVSFPRSPGGTFNIGALSCDSYLLLLGGATAEAPTVMEHGGDDCRNANGNRNSHDTTWKDRRRRADRPNGMGFTDYVGMKHMYERWQVGQCQSRSVPEYASN